MRTFATSSTLAFSIASSTNARAIAAGHALELGAEREVLGDAHLRVERDRLGHVADLLAGLEALLADVVAGDGRPCRSSCRGSRRGSGASCSCPRRSGRGSRPPRPCRPRTRRRRRRRGARGTGAVALDELLDGESSAGRAGFTTGRARSLGAMHVLAALGRSVACSSGWIRMLGWCSVPRFRPVRRGSRARRAPARPSPRGARMREQPRPRRSSAAPPRTPRRTRSCSSFTTARARRWARCAAGHSSPRTSCSPRVTASRPPTPRVSARRTGPP